MSLFILIFVLIIFFSFTSTIKSAWSAIWYNPEAMLKIREAYQKFHNQEISKEEYLKICHENMPNNTRITNLINSANESVVNNQEEAQEYNNDGVLDYKEEIIQEKVKENIIDQKQETKSDFSTWWSIFDNYVSVMDEFKK